MKKLVFFSLIISFLASCELTEGKGGKAAIKGKIFIKDYNQEGILKDEYYASEFPVYIIYGDADFYSDEVKTHLDGSFVFDYLNPGNYTIFAYSKCKDCPGEKEALTVEVSLEKNELVVLQDFEIID